MDRRQWFHGAAAGALALWAAPRSRGQAAAADVERLTDALAVIDAGGTNVVALSTADGFLLVDSGAPGHGDALAEALNTLAANASVHTLINTHYHVEHTGNNERFARSGASVVAHDRTRQWMSTDYWLPDAGRYEPARRVGARPTRTIVNTGSLEAGGERIDYGHMVTAHTGGDIYVYFRDSNVLAVGDVASPVKDPELDWISGGWIGGLVDAMDLLLAMADERTRFVPGTGPVMTYAEFQAERELMELVRQRLFTRVRLGEGPREMLDGGALDGLDRTWDDPYTFLYAAVRGLWGNHNKLDPNVV